MRAGRRAAAILTLAATMSLAGSSVSGTDTAPGSATSGTSDRRAGLSVGLIADAQYCDCDAKNTRYYRDSLAKLARAADALNSRDVDVTVQLGDIIDRHPESFDRILRVYEKVEGPRHHVLGNHDFALSGPEVVDRLGMPNEYYQFSRAGWRFVVLDTNDISLYANAEGSPDHERAQRILRELEASGAPNAKGFNGAAGRHQREWLRRVLDTATTKGQRVVVFGHMPVSRSGQHNAWDDVAIRHVMEAAGNVVAYVHGHDHAGGYTRQNGIHYLGLHAMVEQSPTSNAFAVMHVQRDVLRMEGFGREPDRRLRLGP